MERVMTTAPHKSNVCICDIDWQTFRHRLPNIDSKYISYSTILQELPAVSTSVDGELLGLISKESSREKQKEILLGFVIGWLANWIKGSEEEIDCNVALFTYGIDSVGASVLKSKVESDLQVVLEVSSHYCIFGCILKVARLHIRTPNLSIFIGFSASDR